MAIPNNYIDKITDHDSGESRPICPPADHVSVDNENYEGETLDEVLDEVAQAIEEAGQGGYAPPAGGIPKSDLAQSVQDSLDKADSALQDEDVAEVAKTGSYNDLENKPAIPDTSGLATKTELQQGLGAKQDALVAGNGIVIAQDGKTVSVAEAIRTGAAAGATAYQKPASGIPASDIASGVIPTIPQNIVQSITINGTPHTPTNGVVDLGNVAGEKGDKGDKGDTVVLDPSQVEQFEIINDLTSGGAGNALSAEMGKILKVAISTLIDSMGEYCFPNGRPTLSFEMPKWNVVQHLTNVSSDFQGIKIDKNAELTIHLTTQTNYRIDSVVVMMGDVDVTSTYYTAATGTVYIPQVTGDVDITANAIFYVPNLYSKPENLVFMLDGLSQGGDSNAWTDIIGGVVFTPHGGAAKVAKGWQFDGVNDYMTGDANTPTFDPYSHTIEVCITSGLTNTSYYVFVDGGGYTIANYLYNFQNNDFFVFRGTAYSDSHSTKNGSLKLDRDNGNGVKIVSYNGAVQDSNGGRFNGDIKIAKALSNNSVSGSPSVGARWKESESRYVDFFKGTIHAIRVYNTQLTFAEMLANQKVDNERFELGLTLPNS